MFGIIWTTYSVFSSTGEVAALCEEKNEYKYACFGKQTRDTVYSYICSHHRDASKYRDEKKKTALRQRMSKKQLPATNQVKMIKSVTEAKG